MLKIVQFNKPTNLVISSLREIHNQELAALGLIREVAKTPLQFEKRGYAIRVLLLITFVNMHLLHMDFSLRSK